MSQNFSARKLTWCDDIFTSNEVQINEIKVLGELLKNDYVLWYVYLKTVSPYFWQLETLEV